MAKSMPIAMVLRSCSVEIEMRRWSRSNAVVDVRLTRGRRAENIIPSSVRFRPNFIISVKRKVMQYYSTLAGEMIKQTFAS